MNKLLAGFAALFLTVPATAQIAAPPPLTLEHKMLLRCSAAFALIAYRQEAGHAEVQQYPPLKQRGSEFFVRASARVMEEAGLDRAAISQALEAEARTLLKGGTLTAVMPVCLSALEASEK